MLDLGWSELAVIGVVALIVIGPKDLPKVLRTVGQWTGKVRSMARDFQGSIEDLAREAELSELKKEAQRIAATDIKGEISAAVDPGGDMQRSIEEVARLDLRKDLEGGFHPPADGPDHDRPTPAAPAENRDVPGTGEVQDDQAVPLARPQSGAAS